MLDSLFCVFCTSAPPRLHISSRARGPLKRNSSIRAMIPSSAHWWALLPRWTLQHLTSTPTLLPAGCTVSDRPSSSPVPHCCLNSNSPPLAFTERKRQSLRGQRNMSASLSSLHVTYRSEYVSYITATLQRVIIIMLNAGKRFAVHGVECDHLLSRTQTPGPHPPAGGERALVSISSPFVWSRECLREIKLQLLSDRPAGGSNQKQASTRELYFKRSESPHGPPSLSVPTKKRF